MIGSFLTLVLFWTECIVHIVLSIQYLSGEGKQTANVSVNIDLHIYSLTIVGSFILLTNAVILKRFLFGSVRGKSGYVGMVGMLLLASVLFNLGIQIQIGEYAIGGTLAFVSASLVIYFWKARQRFMFLERWMQLSYEFVSDHSCRIISRIIFNIFLQIILLAFWILSYLYVLGIESVQQDVYYKVTTNIWFVFSLYWKVQVLQYTSHLSFSADFHHWYQDDDYGTICTLLHLVWWKRFVQVVTASFVISIADALTMLRWVFSKQPLIGNTEITKQIDKVAERAVNSSFFERFNMYSLTFAVLGPFSCVDSQDNQKEDDNVNNNPGWLQLHNSAQEVFRQAKNHMNIVIQQYFTTYVSFYGSIAFGCLTSAMYSTIFYYYSYKNHDNTDIASSTIAFMGFALGYILSLHMMQPIQTLSLAWVCCLARDKEGKLKGRNSILFEQIELMLSEAYHQYALNCPNSSISNEDDKNSNPIKFPRSALPSQNPREELNESTSKANDMLKNVNKVLDNV